MSRVIIGQDGRHYTLPAHVASQGPEEQQQWLLNYLANNQEYQANQQEQQRVQQRDARRAGIQNDRQGWNPFNDAEPGFMGGLYSGFAHDMPRLYHHTRAALATDPETATRHQALAQELNQDRDAMGFTDMEDWVGLIPGQPFGTDGESSLQNLGDLWTWGKETFGRTFPAMVAGTAAATSPLWAPAAGVGTGVGLLGSTAIGAVASYPYLLSEMLDRNYAETVDDPEGVDYNFWVTAGLAVPGAAVEGLSIRLVPGRILTEVAQRIGARGAARAAGSTLPPAVTEGILRGTAREFAFGAATGATEETIQSWLGRIAAPGVEALGEGALREYSMAALAGAMMEGPLGGGMHAGARIIEDNFGTKGSRDSGPEEMWAQIEETDEAVRFEETYVPADVNDIVQTLQNSKNAAFAKELEGVQASNVFGHPQEARDYLGRTAGVVQGVIGAFTPEGVQELGFNQEAIDSLSDQQAIRAAEIAMAAGRVTANGYAGFNEDAVFNTGNEQLDKDRRFLHEYTATVEGPDGKPMKFAGFKKSTLFNLPARTTQQLANYLRFQEQADPRAVDRNVVNIKDAVDKTIEDFQSNLDQAQTMFFKAQDNVIKEQRKQLLAKENPYIDAIKQGIIPTEPSSVFEEMYLEPSEQELQTFAEGRDSMTEAQLRDQLKALGVANKDMPTGRMNLLEELFKREKAQKDAANNLDNKQLERIRKQADIVAKNAQQSAGIPLAELLMMPADQRYSYIAKNIPEGKGKLVRNALEKLDYELKELQAESLVKVNAQLLDVENVPPSVQPTDTNTLERLTIDYRDIQTVNTNPTIANNTQMVEAALNKALPGKVYTKTKTNIMNAINNFGKSSLSRSQLTTLVYGMNKMKDLSPTEGHALFFALRDLGVFTEQDMASMRKAIPKYYDDMVAKMENLPDIKTTRKDFDYIDESITLSAIFGEGLATGKFHPGPIQANMSKARNRLITLANTPVKDILGSSWNSNQVRNYMFEAGYQVWHNAQLEARSSSFVVPENLRAQIDAVNNPRTFSLEEGSLTFNTWQWQVNNTKLWKTQQKLSRQDPTLAKLVEFVEHFKDIQENYSHHLLRQYQQLVPDNDPAIVERTKRSLARLSLMRRTGQRLDRRTPDGRLIYSKKDPDNPVVTKDYTVSLEETHWIDEVSSALKAIPMFFKHMMLDNIQARDIEWQGRKLGEAGTTVKDINDYLKMKKNSLKEITDTDDKATLKRELDELEGAVEILSFAEELLDPAIAFFPQQRSQPNTMFRTYNILKADGTKIENPAGTGPEKFLKIVLEVKKDPKTKTPLRASEIEADAKAQRELQEYYIPHFGDMGAAKLSDGVSTRRTHKQNIDVNSGFEAFIGDLTSLLRENKFNSEAATALVEKLRESQARRVGEDILGGAIKNYMVRSSNIGGYNENYLEVLGNYFSIAPYMLATVQFAPLVNRVNDVFENVTRDIPKDVIGEQMDDNQRKWYQRQWKYMTDPVNDWQALRAFNFAYALGFNYSTAVLNLYSIPTIVGPSIMLFGKNPVQATAIMAKATKTASGILNDNYQRARQSGASIQGRTVEMLYDPATNKKRLAKGYKDKTSVLQEGVEYAQNHLQQTLMEDTNSDRISTPVEEKTGTAFDKSKRAWRKALLFAGGPIHYAERFTRLSAFIAFVDAMTNADGTVNTAAVESYLAANKTNQRILQALALRNLNDLSDPQTMYRIAIQLVKETHGVYDKTGRGPIQRGWAGALLFPFMTYPLAVLEHLGNMALHSGPAGKAAFAASMMMFFTFAGIAGFPGAETWKELYEIWERVGFDGAPRSVEADERIHYVLTQRLGLSENMARMLESGVMAHSALNWDMGRRIGVPYPWENALHAIANPGDSYAQSKITGVGGRLLMDLGSGNLAALAPVVAQNVLKATSWPSEGISTRNDVLYKSPEDVTVQEVFTRLLGIQPMSVTAASRDSRRMRTLSTMYMRPHVERVRRHYERDAWELYQARQAGDADKIRAVQARMQRRLYDLRMEAYERGEFITQSQIRGIQQSAANYVTNRSHPYEYAVQQQGNAQESFRYNSTLFNTWMEDRDAGR